MTDKKWTSLQTFLSRALIAAGLGPLLTVSPVGLRVESQSGVAGLGAAPPPALVRLVI